MMDFQAAAYLVEDKVPGQAGNDHPYSTPMGVLETKDGYINIGVGGEGQWFSFCNAIERPELVADPDYADRERRYRNRPKLMSELTTIFRMRSSAEWLEVLEANGVPAGPIYHMDEVFADPQVEHLGIAVPVEHPELGPIRLVGQPLDLSRTPPGIRSPTPEPGAHTDEILRELGLGASEIEALRARRLV
jgi:crotonobetainyl-CoA:carnitine CoA-transferase CaiB-like acyl-CoA transferase